jgi:hypothetical protein
MAVKYMYVPAFFIPRPSKNVSKLGFLECKHTIWQGGGQEKNNGR